MAASAHLRRHSMSNDQDEGENEDEDVIGAHPKADKGTEKGICTAKANTGVVEAPAE